jgi:hypothetical protein
MGVTIVTSTIPGGVTPICSGCGSMASCDISEHEYFRMKLFWDNWRCPDCMPSLHNTAEHDIYGRRQ